MDEIVRRAIKAAGGQRALGRMLGISAVAVGKWKQIPVTRLVDVEYLTRIPREELRPDLYREADRQVLFALGLKLFRARVRRLARQRKCPNYTGGKHVFCLVPGNCTCWTAAKLRPSSGISAKGMTSEQ